MRRRITHLRSRGSTSRAPVRTSGPQDRDKGTPVGGGVSSLRGERRISHLGGSSIRRAGPHSQVFVGTGPGCTSRVRGRGLWVSIVVPLRCLVWGRGVDTSDLPSGTPLSILVPKTSITQTQVRDRDGQRLGVKGVDVLPPAIIVNDSGSLYHVFGGSLVGRTRSHPERGRRKVVESDSGETEVSVGVTLVKDLVLTFSRGGVSTRWAGTVPSPSRGVTREGGCHVDLFLRRELLVNLRPSMTANVFHVFSHEPSRSVVRVSDPVKNKGCETTVESTS